MPYDTIREEIKGKYFERDDLFIRDPKLYLKNILEAISRIEKFVDRGIPS